MSPFWSNALAIFEPLEDRHIWIGDVVVAVDALIVGKSAQRFVVAGVGEKHVIRDIGVGAFVAIAEDLSLLRNHLPNKRHQRLAAFFRAVAPIGLLQRGFIFYFAVLLVHQRLFRAVEDFLPAESVGHDEDDVLRFVLGRNLGASGDRKRDRAIGGVGW